jgi:hypothetical protein
MRAQSGLSQTRRLSAASGVVAVLSLAFVPEGVLANRLAQLAWVAFAFAAALGWLQLGTRVRYGPPKQEPRGTHGSREWLVATAGIALLTGFGIQTWFRVGSSIGLGDTVLPGGTAWVARLFEPWTWSGFNMGEPSQLPLELPWAALLAVVHALGGDPGLAQRIWYTMLFVGAGLGALSLLASLRMGPTAAVVGAVAYVLNPYVASEVNINPIFLAALWPLVAIPAALIAAGTGRLSIRWSAVLVTASAPFLGYIFLNPPLVGMIIGTTLGTPLFVAWVEGKGAALRSLKALALAVVLLLLMSAYWIVPVVLHLSGFTGSQLASLSSWAFTEVRATLRNAFWLNTVWAWRFPEFYPFAPAYDQLPVSLFRFVLPAIAFGALAAPLVSESEARRFRRDRELRLAVAAATVALFLILLSNGTNPPGSVVFDPLYNLPLGWLLREPGRFLMLATVAYAMLIAVTIEVASSHQSLLRLMRLRPLWVPSFRLSVVPASLVTAVLLGFPMYTGAEVPDSSPGLPSGHVQVPAYWTQMASYVDALPVQGAVLILPPDDFYGMPYSWGYYGADSFIPDMFNRHVLVPNPQGYGYVSTSPQVVAAIDLTARSILGHEWPQAAALTTALNTPLILVRRDIESPYQGRQILPPDELAHALEAAPNFDLIRRVGLLELFGLRKATQDTGIAPSFVTVNTQAPDLRLLSMIPPDAALISHQPITGVPNVVQAPPLESWNSSGDLFVWTPNAPLGTLSRLVELDSQTVVALDHAGTYNLGPSKARVEFRPDLASSAITVSITGRSGISNGDFANGLWGQLSDCAAFDPIPAKPSLTATIVPNAAPGGHPALRLKALRLAASFDTACVYQSIDWRGGPLIVSLMVNHVSGSAPRICLWESGPQHCASLSPASSFSAGSGLSIPYGSGWSTYRASAIPDAGTTGISVYLYADSYGPGGDTIVEYANVQVVEVPALSSLALLSDSSAQPTPPVELAVVHNTFSTEWAGYTAGEHVLVDGMLNGWLTRSGSDRFSAYYQPGGVFGAAQWVSLAVLSILVLIPVGLRLFRLVRRRRSRTG